METTQQVKQGMGPNTTDGGLRAMPTVTARAAYDGPLPPRIAR